MKSKIVKYSISIFLLTSLFFSISCTEDIVSIEPPNNESKITIDQGAWGTVRFFEGDFMPVYDPETGGTITPVVRDIYIYEATTDDMVERDGYGGFYKSIASELIAVVQSDQDGFFQIKLEPGKYSFFVKEDSLYYGSKSDGEGHIVSEHVFADSTTEVTLNITYLATY